MLPVQQLFAGGAMNPTAGMAMNPLLQGFGSYQNMQNDFTDRGLNQSSQDIANQAAQHALDQSRLGDPLAAAQRERDLGNVGIDQTQINSGQALATRQAADQAKQSKSFADMSNDEITKAENQRVALIDVAQHMQEDGYLMNPGRQKADKAYMESHGAKGWPDVVTPEFIAQVQKRAADAPDDLQAIRKQRIAAEAHRNAMELGQQKGEYGVKAAEAGFKTREALQQNALPDDVKVMKQASDEYAQNHGVMSQQTFEQAYNVLKNKNRADPDLKDTAKTAVDRLSAYSAKELPAKAAALGIDTKGKNREEILADAQTYYKKQLVEKQTMDDLAQRFPNAKVQKEDGTVIDVATGKKVAAPGTTVTPSTSAAPVVPTPPDGTPAGGRNASMPVPPGGGPQTPAVTSGPPKIKSAADYKALPPGPYTDPDGVLRVKK